VRVAARPPLAARLIVPGLFLALGNGFAAAAIYGHDFHAKSALAGWLAAIAAEVSALVIVSVCRNWLFGFRVRGRLVNLGFAIGFVGAWVLATVSIPAAIGFIFSAVAGSIYWAATDPLRSGDVQKDTTQP
jgi:hypothetical protein